MKTNDIIVTENLKKIVDFENKILTDDLNNSSFKFSEKNFGEITKNNKVFSIKIDRPFIHTMGKRIWPNISEIIDLHNQWENLNINDLQNEINSVLNRGEYQIRYTNQGNTNMVYGIVTKNFVNVNPINFREEFIKEISKHKFIKENSIKTGYTRFGEVTELFNFHQDDNTEIELSIGLIYGRNSGYSSYRLFWERKIVSCENQMTDQMSKINWKHNNQILLNNFLTNIVDETIGYSNLLIKRIEEAKNRNVLSQNFDELMARFHTAKIVKERVKQKFDDEKINEGNNEYALSQAFTNIGTHFYKASKDMHHAGLCIDAGSKIIDYSLQSFLDGKVDRFAIDGQNTYGTLLPKNYSRN
jgi:hypothetical protein